MQADITSLLLGVAGAGRTSLPASLLTSLPSHFWGHRQVQIISIAKSVNFVCFFWLLQYFCKIHSWNVLIMGCLIPSKYARFQRIPSGDNNLKSLAVKSVPVRVRLPAPNQYNPNLVFPVGDGFGLFVFFGKFEETHFRNGVIKRPESKPRGPRKRKQI